MEKIKKAIKKRKTLYLIALFLVKIVWVIYHFIRERNALYHLALKIKTLINTRYKLNSYQIISVKEFCSKNNLKYLVVEKEQTREVCIPNYYGYREGESIRTAISPEIYIAELTDAEIIGANSFIIADDYCLYDMATMDDKKRYDLRWESLKTIDKNNIALVMSINSNQTLEEAIFLIGFASSNYFHFTIELLSRLKHIDFFEEYRQIPLLIDEIVFEIPQFIELLQTINKYNHPIILIERQYRYKVKRLIFPAYNTWMPINVNDGESLIYKDFIVANSGIEYIRNTVLKERNLEGNRKIFVSRKNHSQRIANEKEVVELFSQYGFEIIYPEELTFYEQVQLFSSAKYVAGSTGAAFTNIIYCPHKITFICIMPKEYNFYMYSTIGRIVQLNIVFLDARVIKKGMKISGNRYELDLNYCKEFLKTL